MLSLIWNKAYTGEEGRHYHRLGVEKEKKGKCNSNLVIDESLDYYSYSSLVVLIFVYNIV